MTFENFNKDVMLPTFDQLLKISETKGKEYANGVNRFANFVSSGERLGIPPDAILMIFMDKHMNSITHHIKTAESFSEPIEGRIDDAIMYLLLLKGLWRDMGKSGRDEDANKVVRGIIREQIGTNRSIPPGLEKGDRWREIKYPNQVATIVQFPINTHNVLYTYGAQDIEMDRNEFCSKFTFIPSNSK